MMVGACHRPGLGTGPSSRSSSSPDSSSEAGPDRALSASPPRPFSPVERTGKPSGGACDDGVDNDGDGNIDWAYDLGCSSASDDDETSGSLENEEGFSTFDIPALSNVAYVSQSEGDDRNDGRSPLRAVKSLERGASLLPDQRGGFLLLKRGDTWKGEDLGAFKSGKSRQAPLVIASYGESTERPLVLVNEYFINHNGAHRSFLRILGLHIAPMPKVPGDPKFTGEKGGTLRFVGGGTDILIEDCQLSYGGLVIQSYKDKYRDVRVRRNIIEFSYTAGTCDRRPTRRPQGLYLGKAEDVLIEENLFDHNGWNEDVKDACATMYNQNLYLNAKGMVIRNNIIARASSIGIKLASPEPHDVSRITIDGNLFVEGEIGVSVGGNAKGADRFTHISVLNNVFSQIGVTQPTERSIAWGVDVIDNRDSVVEGNYFADFAPFGNSFGVRVSGVAQHDVRVKKNVFHNLFGSGVVTRTTAEFSQVVFEENVLVEPQSDSCLVTHRGDFQGVTYRGNQYRAGASSRMFCTEDPKRRVVDWQQLTGEEVATFRGKFREPTRSVGSYAATLGVGTTLVDFLKVAKRQTRLSWNAALTAPAINDYIREGFLQE